MSEQKVKRSNIKIKLSFDFFFLSSPVIPSLGFEGTSVVPLVE